MPGLVIFIILIVGLEHDFLVLLYLVIQGIKDMLLISKQLDLLLFAKLVKGTIELFLTNSFTCSSDKNFLSCCNLNVWLKMALSSAVQLILVYWA